MVCALDSSTIELCLALCPWATLHHGKGSFKMHILMDLKGSIPVFIRLTEASIHDSKVMDEIRVVTNAYYLLDKGYVKFGDLLQVDQAALAHQNLLRHYPQICIAICDYLLLIIAKRQYGLKLSLHTISNFIGQILFKRGYIRDFYSKPDEPVNVPEDDSNRQLNLW